MDDIEDILNIDGLQVTQVQQNGNDYRITVETTSPPCCCPHCREVNPPLQKFGTKDQMFMDLPIHAKRVGILVKRQRFRCKSCGSTFLEELQMMDDKRSATTRMLKYVGEQLMQRTFVSIADEIGIDEKTVRNIFNDYVEHLKSTVKIETPRLMGINE